MRRASINTKPVSIVDDNQFFPNLCSLQAVFLLAMLGELLALSLSVANSGLQHIDWLDLGLRSFLLQWVLLLTAAMLCGLRLWLGRQSPIFAGVVSYGLVLSVTLACTILGQFFLSRRLPDLWVVIDNLVLAAIFGGIVLRYLYIQQQLHNQQQAELRARIQALQSRIRPHFLFNSLNSIASLVATDADTAERMIEDLASLFRASLQEPGLISLSEELELCRQYVAIEQRRLGDRLQVNWQISEELEPQLTDIRFPSLLLQPLLENAIHHGIQPRPEGGEVWLQLQIEDGYLRINMTNPVMQELPGLLVSGHSGNQMALDNIHYRLQAYYNGQAELKMHKNVDIFEVALTIPI